MHNGDEHFIPCSVRVLKLKGKKLQSLSKYLKLKAIISFVSIGTSREDEGFAHLEKLNL